MHTYMFGLRMCLRLTETTKEEPTEDGSQVEGMREEAWGITGTMRLMDLIRFIKQTGYGYAMVLESL